MIMASWSRRRQFSYFLLLVVLVAAGAAGAFFWYRPTPSCADGRQNQGELGVDCGGVCQAVCLHEVLPLKVAWTRIFTVVDGVYEVAALLTNPNPNLLATKVPYVIRLVDENNILITLKRGETFLNPRETFAVFASGFDVGRRKPARAFLEFDPAPNWQRAQDTSPTLVVKKEPFTNEPSPRLAIELSNDSRQTWENVQLSVVLSDRDHNAFAASATVIERLAAGETGKAVFTWPKPFADQPMFIDVYPHLRLD